jgi:hypothetical protein
MLCSIYKWRISKALDKGDTFSNKIQHHLQNCGSCRDFAEFSQQLETRSAAAQPDFQQGFPISLPGRIMAALDAPSQARSQRRFFSTLLPVASSAVLILAVSASVYFLTTPRLQPLEPLEELLPLNQAQTSLGQTLNQLDSPLEKEYQNLKSTVEATTDYLLSRFDIKLGQEQE